MLSRHEDEACAVLTQGRSEGLRGSKRIRSRMPWIVLVQRASADRRAESGLHRRVAVVWCVDRQIATRELACGCARLKLFGALSEATQESAIEQIDHEEQRED